ncbi:unnamed protein product [Citrullus colocynthis]|uniref:Uncharacterized protein n=1 Tax=Citrullus colocynthis TaxID=252529 RepID=A0ABP0YL30_9ROSI
MESHRNREIRFFTVTESRVTLKLCKATTMTDSKSDPECNATRIFSNQAEIEEINGRKQNPAQKTKNQDVGIQDNELGNRSEHQKNQNTRLTMEETYRFISQKLQPKSR